MYKNKKQNYSLLCHWFKRNKDLKYMCTAFLQVFIFQRFQQNTKTRVDLDFQILFFKLQYCFSILNDMIRNIFAENI